MFQSLADEKSKKKLKISLIWLVFSAVIFGIGWGIYFKSADLDEYVIAEIPKADVSDLVRVENNSSRKIESNAIIEKSPDTIQNEDMEKLNSPELTRLSKEAFEQPDKLQELLRSLPNIELRGVNLIDLVRSNYSKNRRIPFSFKLVDQEGEPVASAQVSVTYSQMGLGINSISSRELIFTDSEGLFRTQKRAVDFRFDIVAPGLEFVPVSASFTGSGDIDLNQYTSNDKPYIVTGWRQGLGQVLSSGQALFQISPGGSPKILPIPELHDALTIAVEKDSAGSVKQRGSWGAILEVLSGGGIQEATDQFRRVAPESGYKTRARVSFEANSEKTSPRMVRKAYYLKTSDGKIFGSLNVTFLPYVFDTERFHLRLSYLLNSGGSRSLEIDQSKLVENNLGTIFLD